MFCPRQGLSYWSFHLVEHRHSQAHLTLQAGAGPQLPAFRLTPVCILPIPNLLPTPSHPFPLPFNVTPAPGPGNCPTGDPCGTSDWRALGTHTHGPHPKEGRPEGTERARSWPPAARVQRAGWGLTRHPQESRRAGCGAAAGVPACLSAPVNTKRQGPTVRAGGGSWPCPRAASGPRTLLPALRLWCSRTPWVGDSVRTGPHRIPLCWPTHSTGGAQDLWAG